MPSYNFDNNVLNTFVNGQIVSADDATYGLNPKMSMIADAINDHATSIDTLVGQVGALGGLVYNVTTYGADPTGVTDSTVAIQNAINAAVIDKGIVVFSNGTYTISDTLNVNASCYITSDGSGTGVTIRQVTSNKGFFNSLPTGSASIRITDLILDIQNTATSNGLVYFQRIAGVGNSLVVQRCTFTSTSATKYGFLGVYIQGASSGAVTDCTFTGTASTTSNGVSLYDSANVLIARNSFTYMTNVVTTNSTAPVVGGIVKGLVIENNYIYLNKGDGLYIRYITDVLINNNIFEQFVGTALKNYPINLISIKTASVSQNFIDHTSSSTTFYHGGVVVNGGSYVQVLENTFLYGGTTVELIGGCSLSIVSKNYLLEPNGGAISASSVLDRSIISENIIIDVWSASTAVSAISCTSTSGTPTNIVSANAAVRKTKSATNVNTYGITVGGAVSPYALVYGNELSGAITPMNTSLMRSFFVEPSGVKVYYNSAAPTTGTWTAGTKVLLETPIAGGYIGYVCTVAGTPGTWKGFGLVQV